jgi:hypothetical protein
MRSAREACRGVSLARIHPSRLFIKVNQRARSHHPKNREAQKIWCIVSQRVDTVLDNYRSAQVLGFTIDTNIADDARETLIQTFSLVVRPSLALLRSGIFILRRPALVIGE